MQEGPAAGCGAHAADALHPLGARTTPDAEVKEKMEAGAQTAVFVPWQESVWGAHESPSAHRVAERGIVGAADAFPPARATSHEAHAGVAVMPSAEAVPR
jgi:hypothetical protein